MKERVLVIAAHPDDELLGCGGKCIMHSQKEDEVRAIIVCEGESMRYSDGSVHQAVSTEKAAKLIGFSKIYALGFPDQHLDTMSLVDVISPIEKIVEEYLPTIVYCQSGLDINRDHQIVYEAACVALRPVQKSIHEFLTFYTPSSSVWGIGNKFEPDTWVELDEQTLLRKIKAFEYYESENKQYPHPRSSESLRNIASFFGNQNCMRYAEAYKTVRRLERI